MRQALLIFALIFLVACSPIKPLQNATVIACTPPSYEYTPGDCCLDADANKACDRDEQYKPSSPTAAVVAEQEPSALSEVIGKFENGVSSYSYKEGGAEYIVKGGLIHVKLDTFRELPTKINNTIRSYVTDLFIDREAAQAIGYCDPRSEERIVGEFNADRSNCIKIIDLPFALPYGEYNPFLPEDWLQRFANATPTLVEDTDQYVKQESGWKAVNPVLHFQENNIEYILRIDAKYGIPLRVEQRIDDKTTAQEYANTIYNTIKPAELVYQPFHK